MNETEKAGVLRNEKVEIETFLFPFPAFSFLLTLLLLFFFLIEGNGIAGCSVPEESWMLTLG